MLDTAITQEFDKKQTISILNIFVTVIFHNTV